MLTAALSSIGLVSTPNQALAIVAAVSASAAAAVLMVRLMLDLEGRASAHRACGARLWHIREQFRGVLADLKDGELTLDAARVQRDQLMARLHAIYDNAPPADRTLYEAARSTPPDAHEDADLREAVEALVAVGPATGDLAAAHRRLFGHTARGEAPPYETEYGAAAPVQQPYELADVTGFLRAFGLGVDPARHERVDHVSCECEFLAFLALKEIWAHDRGENATLVETRRATKLFLRDHLARFAPAFGRRLADMDPAGFYGNLGRLLRCLVRGDCARLGIPCGPDLLRLRSVDEPGVPMACGSAGAPCDEGACAVNEPPAAHRSGGPAEG